jgi:hypothetical protein
LRENKIPAVRYGYRLTHPTNWNIIYRQTPYLIAERKIPDFFEKAGDLTRFYAQPG